MSSAKHSFADISGIDWMISFIRWKSRILPSGGNNFSIIADVSDVFDYKKFEKKFHSLENTKTFLSGTIRRKFPDWTPRWYYGSGKGEGMVCEADKSSLEIEITGFLPKGVSLKAVFFEKKK